MELDNAIDGLTSTVQPVADEGDVVAMAVQRLTTETFQVLAKGLNPSRFDSWQPGARSKVARQYGSSADLMCEVFARALAHDEPVGRHLTELGCAALEQGLNFEDTLRSLGAAYVDLLRADDRFRLRVVAWSAAVDRSYVADDLESWYDTYEVLHARGWERFLAAAGRRVRDGVDLVEHVGMMMQMAESVAMQGAFRHGSVTRERFAEYLLFFVNHATEEVPASSE